MASTAEAREVIKPFDVADTVYLKGVTVEQAREAMALCASGSSKVSPDAAAAMVDRLLDFYSHQSFRSPSAAAAFSAALVTLVTEVRPSRERPRVLAVIRVPAWLLLWGRRVLDLAAPAVKGLRTR